MKHYIHDPDRNHTYRTESGVKPEYDEAMEWWENYKKSTPDIDQNFTEQQLAGKEMYEYITELMCIECTSTKEELELGGLYKDPYMAYNKQQADEAGIGEIYPEKNGKKLAELREQAKELGYTVYKESSEWIDQEDLSEQMANTIMASIIIAISLSASILIAEYIIRTRKKK